MAWPVSEAFKAACAQRVRYPAVQVDVLEGGAVVASSEPAEVGVDLKVTKGSVEVTRRSTVRRSAQVTLADSTGVLEAVASGSLLDPRAGREFRLWATLDDHPMIPLGTFGIDAADVSETRDGVVIDLAGRDRMAAVSGISGWTAPYQASDGTDLVGAALLALVTQRLGYAPSTNLAPSAYVVPRATYGGAESSDPAEDAHTMVAAAGMQALFDPMGTLAMRPVPDPTSTPVAYSSRLGSGVLVPPFKRSVSRDTLRNGYIVHAAAPWLLFPITAEAWDTDPDSPTYAGVLPGGADDPDNPGIGKHPERKELPTVGTQTQADAAAAAGFLEVVGIEEAYAAEVLPLYFLDADDAVEVESPAMGLVRLVIDQTTVVLDEGTQPLSGRRRRR